MIFNPKRFSSLQARAALAGAELQAVRNDAERWTIYATVGPVTLELQDLERADAWVEQLCAAMEGPNA